MEQKPRLKTGTIAPYWVLLLVAFTPAAADSSDRGLSPRDAAIIEEAYNVWFSVVDGIWPGASQVFAPMVYIGEQYEYAIGFAGQLTGFTNAGSLGTSQRRVQLRLRTLAPDLAASFPSEGTPAVVIGSPEGLGKGAGQWVLTASHEMFHVFQAAQGMRERVTSLDIGPQNDASWHLTFPFPYGDSDVMRLIHLQGYLLWLAFTGPDMADARYNVSAALDTLSVYRSRLDQMRPDGKDYRYSVFQEWNEGVAAYTEFRIAQVAGSRAYQPTKPFSTLPGFQSYEELWKQVYQDRVYLVKHAGRAAKSRTA
ncbi:MAG: hypothetical protein QOJ99_1704, partial [Bryobacterales bacterium]|nr:hypothetical protein [Bryobacterales bacterium]